MVSTWRANLWKGMDALMARLYRASVQVWHLQRVLAKKKDPATHKPLLSLVLPALQQQHQQQVQRDAQTAVSSRGQDGVSAGAGAGDGGGVQGVAAGLFPAFWLQVTQALKDCVRFVFMFHTRPRVSLSLCVCVCLV